MKKVGLCLLGIISSILLLSVFVTFDVTLSQIGLLRHNDMRDTVWRFDCCYQPVIVLIVAFGVSLVDTSKAKGLLGVMAVLPFLFLNINASSYSGRSMIFSAVYLAIAIAAATSLRRRQASESKAILTAR